jgi:lysophospholipase L1-like esterase
MVEIRVVRAAAVTAGLLGGVSAVAYGVLNGQSRAASLTIGEPEAPPFNADGLFTPDGAGPLPSDPAQRPVRFVVIGDSAAAGLGVDGPEQLPGVLLSGGLAEETNRPVLLTTYAVVGATSRDLAGQVDEALVEPPNVALIIIGSNDVSDRMSVRTSARLLGAAVRRLREAGVAVVVGTTPDLSAIRPIPEPLRSIAGALSRQLARAQRAAVSLADGVSVPLADLLSPEFFARPDELFSADRYHPNAAGYEAAVSLLLAPLYTALCAALGTEPAVGRTARTRITRRQGAVVSPLAVPSN